MLLLGDNISSHTLNIRMAYRKSSIPALLGELGQDSPIRLDPLGRSTLDFAHQLCDREVTRECAENMNMVCSSSNRQDRTIQVVTRAAKIRMDLLAEILVNEKWIPALR